MTTKAKNGARFLLVQDEPAAAKMLTRILDMEGFRASTAPDGVSALEQMASETPDALITDLKMPRGGGPELVREAGGQHVDLPIVVVTGFFTGEVERELKQLGASTVLLKPVELRDLIDAIKNALNNAAG